MWDYMLYYHLFQDEAEESVQVQGQALGTW